MCIAITGTTGFLGKRVKNAFITQDINILEMNRDVLNALDTFTLEAGVIQRFIHVAGKAHVLPKNDLEVRSFFEVNFELVKSICLFLERSKNIPKQFVFISTVSVYGVEVGHMIDESFPLNPTTPYAKSKRMAEEYLVQWGNIHDVKILILRLPLIAGKNPPGNLGKMITAISKRRYMSLGGGKARRSMVLAQDVGNLITQVQEADGVYNLTDNYHPSFNELEQTIASYFKVSKPKSIPLLIAKALGKLGDIFPFFPLNTNMIIKMTSSLSFDDSKAKKELFWKPKSSVKYLFTS